MPDTDRHADDATGLQIGIGKPYSPSLSFELTSFRDIISQTDGDKFKQNGVMFDGIYFHRYNKIFSLTPYSVVGIGLIETQFVQEKKQLRFTGNLGVGVMHMFDSYGNMALRSDIRLRIDEANLVNENHFNDYLVNIALIVPLGELEKDRDRDRVLDKNDACPYTPLDAKVDAKGCEIDSDSDGIVDSRDICLNTPIGTPIDIAGCPLDSDKDGVYNASDVCPETPIGRSVDEKGCELDSDKDGVVDDKDLCHETPLGTSVNVTGCAPTPVAPIAPVEPVVPPVIEGDRDNDGVPDSKDICPESKHGDKVNASGCKVNEAFILKGVNFVAGSHHLFPYSASKLSGVAETLRQNPEVVVEVAGYTDNLETPDRHQELSERRAQAVVDYLVSKGVSAANLKSVGYGEANPIATNNTAAGRTKNRRVELHIQK